MTVRESPAADAGGASSAPLELLTDDERIWTAIPADASEEQRMTMWVSIAGGDLCDLEEWR